jgi:hypothetical protein
VQILLLKPRFSKAPEVSLGFTNQMKSGEAIIPIQKRRAVERGRRISNATISVILSFVVTAAAQSERINQEGRILGPALVVTTPTLFNTPQAGAIVSAMQIFPMTNQRR